MLHFKIEQQNLALLRSSERVVADSQNYLVADFAFSSDWDGLVKVVQFHRSVPHHHFDLYLDAENKCVVPWEVLKYEGEFTVNVFGQSDVGEENKLATVNHVTVNVYPSGLINGELPETPTQGVAAQTLAEIREKASSAATSESNASASATAAAGSATAAATSAGASANSASASANSASAANNSASAAATSAGNASTSESNAAASATAAVNSASTASTKASEAAASAATATEKANEASTSATNAGNSARAAATSQNAAATSERNAATSTQNAARSAQTATEKAQAAGASATAAAASEVNARTYADTVMEYTPQGYQNVADVVRCLVGYKFVIDPDDNGLNLEEVTSDD